MSLLLGTLRNLLQSEDATEWSSFLLIQTIKQAGDSLIKP